MTYKGKKVERGSSRGRSSKVFKAPPVEEVIKQRDKEITEQYKKRVKPDGSLLKIAESDWAKKQGKTQAPLANLLTIGSAAAAATAAAPGAAASLSKGLAKDWANRTLSDAAWAKFQKTGKMPKGLKGWRPLKAGSWKQLKTGATVQAERLLQGLGISGGITASPTFAK